MKNKIHNFNDIKSINSVGSIKEKSYDTIPFRVDFIKELLNGKKLTPMIAKEVLDDFAKEQEKWQWMRIKVRVETYKKFNAIKKETKHAFKSDDELIDFILGLVTDDLLESL